MKKGDRLKDRYELQEKVGRGGFAVVWSAVDLKLRRPVAVKLLSPSATEEADDDAPDPVEQFKREAQAVAQLQHPHIVTVFDADTDGSHAFIVMDLLPGGNLADRLLGRLQTAGRPFDLPEALALLRPIAQALAAAHDAGLIHRDVKPHNILFTADGRPVLTDFGLVKVLGNRFLSRQTFTGAGLKGTLAYMAPEQVRRRAVDARTDLYGLAVTLAQLLTGKAPFLADSEFETMSIITSQPAREALAAELPHLAPGVRAWLLKGLAVDPGERPDSPVAWIDGLQERLQAAEQTIAREQQRSAAQAALARWLKQEQFDEALVTVGRYQAETGDDDGAAALRAQVEAAQRSAQEAAAAQAARQAVQRVEQLLAAQQWVAALTAVGGLAALGVEEATVRALQQRAEDGLQRAAPRTRGGLPVIAAWEELRGRVSLPPRIIWARDGKEMALIPGGPFLMGTPEPEARKLIGWIKEPFALAEAPQRTLTLPAFYIDVTPVTHAEYAAFIAANPAQPVPTDTLPLSRPLSWDTTQRTPPAPYGQHPVVLVTWHHAQAYAEWAGKALPAEPQWEKAARGANGRIYPWGNEWDRTRCNSAEGHHGKEFANVSEWWAWWNPIKDAKETTGVFTTPVGAYPTGATPEGVFDLAGNVWEWCADWYQPYPGTPSQAEEFGETHRVLRGGSWIGNGYGARAADRGRVRPVIRLIDVGFRCASTPF